MSAMAKILSRGRITIPKEIREYLTLRTGDKIIFAEEPYGFVIKRKS